MWRAGRTAKKIARQPGGFALAVTEVSYEAKKTGRSAPAVKKVGRPLACPCRTASRCSSLCLSLSRSRRASASENVPSLSFLYALKQDPPTKLVFRSRAAREA
jgi:hypothetical protein